MLPRWWRRNFLLVEWAIAVLGTIVIEVCLWILSHNPLVESLLHSNPILEKLLVGNRAAIYGTAASIFGSLLGFVITAFAIVFSVSSSERLSLLRQSPFYKQLWDIFTSSIRATGLGTLLALVSLVADRDSHPIPLLQLFTIFALMLVALRFTRMIWIVGEIVKLLTAPSKARSAEDP